MIPTPKRCFHLSLLFLFACGEAQEPPPSLRVLEHELVRAEPGQVLLAGDAAARPELRALAYLQPNVDLRRMNATNAIDQLEIKSVLKDELGQTHVRVAQRYKGLEVFGAEAVVHLDDRGVIAANGSLHANISLDVTPRLSRDEASAIASAKKRDAQIANAALVVFRNGALQGSKGEDHLAWSIEVDHERVFVDARNGAILARISLRPHIQRIIYSPIYDPANPNLFVQRREGGMASLLPPVNDLYDFAGQTYDLFFRAFGRRSYDGNEAIMRSVYLINQQCPNAYWDGASTNYCPTFDVDDVVSHEWTHAYTQHTHGLIYAYQSGALNEAYSDIFGELLDLTNSRDGIGGANNGAPAPGGQRWLVGEDVPVLNQPALGILRDMWTPTTFGDPDRVSAAEYHCDSSDGGGVHTNSGVPNHAFAMLVDGKTFNGVAVGAIGRIKAAHIYYRAMTVYQFSSSDFTDHADALEASCADLRLAGTNLRDWLTGQPSGQVITQADCDNVARAMLAVEMRSPPVQCNFQALLDPNTPPACDGATVFFSENWASGLGAWTLASSGVTPEWPGTNWTISNEAPDGYGTAAFAFDSRGGTCAPGGDYSGHFSMDSPAITIPSGAARAELRFDHFVETEAGYDGGNLLASVNGGAFTLVPETAYTFNAPASELEGPPPLGNNTNPKAGELAWHGANGGTTTGSWGTTIVNLTALAPAGSTVRLRWDFGQDGCNGVTGWFVGRVEATTCN